MPDKACHPATQDRSPAGAPKLLLPAGSPEKLRYAVAYGADAVYLGLPMASLRTPSRGEQFTPRNLEANVRYAQERGVKAYITANIFASNRDLDRLAPHLAQLEAIRPDAVILSDPGVFRLARKHAPSVPVHLSTQANTLNSEACAFWQDRGVQRVILAREVPLREIAEIHEALPDLELECFVHGSLCVAYSGRCVISDYLTGNTKNSNKGMCGNSCRWEFESPESGLKTMVAGEVTRPHEIYTFEEDGKGAYMLNSRDLCLVRRLRALQEAGVVSFKVEGRTKSLYYVATTGRIYREAIDYFKAHDTAPEELLARWTAELSAAGNRGFTEGFLHGRPGSEAYNYADSRSHQTARFLAAAVSPLPATPPSADGRTLLRFQARNPFRLGDAIEWVTPSGIVPTSLSALYDKDGLPRREAQTNQIVAVPVPETLQGRDDLVWSLLRSAQGQTPDPSAERVSDPAACTAEQEPASRAG